ncbi:hypothetical protein ABZ642_04215 [Streptomyces sp. NPDC007157]|uniref:hypothetical protein n=1 Tax=Streptomyces sp. NPDC007157 TaxID=3154681 RepID=UPI0033FDC742
MAYDPTDPDVLDDLRREAEDAPEIDVESPEVDAAEQHTDVAPSRDDPLTGVDEDRANEADLIEQARVVSLDEEDYR